MGGDETECRPCHRRPSVDEHEVDWTVHILEGFSEITFAEVDETRQTSFGKMASRHPDLPRLMLCADHDRMAAHLDGRRRLLPKIIPDGSSKKDGGNTDPTSLRLLGS